MCPLAHFLLFLLPSSFPPFLKRSLSLSLSLVNQARVRHALPRSLSLMVTGHFSTGPRQPCPARVCSPVAKGPPGTSRDWWGFVVLHRQLPSTAILLIRAVIREFEPDNSTLIQCQSHAHVGVLGRSDRACLSRAQSTEPNLPFSLNSKSL